MPPAHFSRLWKLDEPGAELRRLGIDGPGQLAAQFMADADALRELTSRTAPLVDDHPRRIRSAWYPEPAKHYAWLMDAARGRERLETRPWAGILPSSVLASSADAFRLRAMFDAALYPDLRGEYYEFWSDLAALPPGRQGMSLGDGMPAEAGRSRGFLTRTRQAAGSPEFARADYSAPRCAQRTPAPSD